MNIKHTLLALILSTFFLLNGLNCLGQQRIKGTYLSTILFTAHRLKIQSNHSFSLRIYNWESGNGIENFGKWLLKNDTLYLKYSYSKKVSGTKKGGIKVHALKTKITKTDTLFVSNNFLCEKLPADEYCYKRLH